MNQTFTRIAVKALAVCGFAMMANTASATIDNHKLYLTDVYTVEDLTSDIFGVPMRVDHIDGGKYVARYYNEKAGNKVYILGTKTDFSDVIGAAEANKTSGDLSMGSNLEEVEAFTLPEANKYYQIEFDVDEFNYSISTYEVADYMDPVFYELNSYNLNVWMNYADRSNDSWEPGEGAWLREFYFGYTCTEYLINDNNEYVDLAGNVVTYDKEAGIDERVKATKHNPVGEEVEAEQLRWCEPWTQNPNNKHQYIWNNAKHFVAGQKLNFIVHNWHEAGWWNAYTWRVDDEEECDIFYYYGEIVKKAYLDWAWGGKADWSQWIDGEGHRKDVIYGGGGDNWCKPTVQKTDDYVFVFDTHLGRGKMVPASKYERPSQGMTSIAEDANAPVQYYNLQGMQVREGAMAPGIYIKRQGNKAQKVLIR